MPYWRLSVPLFLLALKDLLQAFLYRNINNHKINRTLTSLSWIHICFQPLIVNIILSHFSQDKSTYWNCVFVLCIVYGLYSITELNEFDIQNDPDCVKMDEKDDFCSEETLSYIGKYHVAYRFSQDKRQSFNNNMIYGLLMFLPALVTKSWILDCIWFIFVMSLHLIFPNVGTGEYSAIWCFLSIIFAVPVALYGSSSS